MFDSYKQKLEKKNTITVMSNNNEITRKRIEYFAGDTFV